MIGLFTIKIRKSVTFICVSIMSAVSVLNAEKADNDGGFGVAIVPNIGFVNPGLASGLDLNIYKYGSLIHKLRIAAADDLSGSLDSSNNHIEVGYLIGKWSRNKAGYLSAMIGLSVVETVSKGKELVAPTCGFISCFGGEYEMHKSITAGIPFHLEAVLMYNVIGFGVALTGNINYDASYAGIVFEIPIGWVPFR